MDKLKQQQVEAMPTEAIEHILATLGANEMREPSAEYPLGGLVHITSIGQVSVAALRAELARRES